MDPLSISTGCLALLTAVAQTTVAITNFIRSYRDARDDLTGVTRELSELSIVLQLLKDDSALEGDKAAIPEPLQKQIASIITNCTAVVTRINNVLQKFSTESKTDKVKWVVFGKGEITGLRMSLEAHRGSLNLALELLSITLAKAIRQDTIVIKDQVIEIKDDTGVTRDHVVEIKQETAQIPQIMEELETLRALVASFTKANEAPEQSYVLQQYLDGLTDYAETVITDDSFELEQGDGLELTLPEAPATTSKETITWYGQITCKPGQSDDQPYFRERQELSNANYWGRWTKVIQLLKSRRDYHHETWANCWRIGL
jgi:hypothetical protein